METNGSWSNAALRCRGHPGSEAVAFRLLDRADPRSASGQPFNSGGLRATAGQAVSCTAGVGGHGPIAHPGKSQLRLPSPLGAAGIPIGTKREWPKDLQTAEAQTLVGASKDQSTGAARERLGEPHLKGQPALGDGPDACELRFRRMGSSGGSHRLLRSRVSRPGVRHQGRAKEAERAIGGACIKRSGALRPPGDAPVLRSDNGLILQSRRFRSACRDFRLRQEFLSPYRPEQNGITERFFRSLKEECAWPKQFRSFAEAKREISQWIEWYNAGRPHQSLGCKSPREYRADLSESVA
jgi:hypothetical protein